MNSTFLFKYYILITLLFVFSCQTVETVMDETFNKEESIPEINKIEKVDKITLNSPYYLNNFENKLYINEVKHIKTNQIKLKTFIMGNNFYTLNNKSQLFINNSSDGKLVKSFFLLKNKDDDELISNLLINNYFILGYSSGNIVKVDLDGNIIWSFQNNKIFNSFLYEIDDLLIVFFGDEIIALNLLNGKILWSEKFEDFPIIQAKGGQIVIFFNNLYFTLPNGRLGLVDLNLGQKDINKFVSLDLRNSINNSKDKLYLYENYLTYLDEGEFLYVYDLLSNEFIINNFKINSSNSNYFYNNTLVIKNGNFLEAINLLNGNSFWLIKTDLNKNSRILKIQNVNDNLYIFMDNGKIAVINKAELVEVLDLKMRKIHSLYFLDNKLISILENGKIGFF